jgi:hypothetical protein
MCHLAASRISCVIVFLACTALTLTGCYQDPVRAKLAGTWKIEHGEKLSKRVNQDQPDAVEDPGERMMLAFTASGSLRTKTRIGDVIREKNGSWNVVDFDEEQAVMTIRCELMGQQTEHEVQLVEADLIRLVPPNMAGTKSKLTFRRE